MGGFISKPRPRNSKPKIIISRSPSTKESSRASSVNSVSSSTSTNTNNSSGIFREASNTAIDGLQVLHYMFRGLWGNNYSAPVADILKIEGSRVLDLR
ncbi:4666_t:CDS:1, partial [Racocetra persica]